MAANSLLIDPDALNALRNVLMDTDEENFTYPTERLVLGLRDNRETVLYRNPLVQASSIFAYPLLYYGRGRTPINKHETVRSHLQPEPGKRCFQADRSCRHWDSLQPATVYKNGVVQTLTTDYTVDYPEGRVTFVADAQDYEVVMASYCFYRIYHAARAALLWRLSNFGNTLVSWSDADASERYGTVKDAIAAVDYAISDMTPRNIASGRKIY